MFLGMISYLLAVLLHIQHIDNSVAFVPMDNQFQERMADQLLQNEYHSPHRIYHALPPLRSAFFLRPSVPITANAGIVVDSMSGSVLWQKNIDQSMPVASLTKLMTAIVFLETNPDFDAEVTIIDEDVLNVIGSKLYVQPGEKVTVRDLFHACLVGSANNATKALVRSTGMTEGKFVRRMNEKASALGLAKTVFHEVTGLDPNNVSTVKEYAAIANYAFHNAAIREALMTDTYTFETIGKRISHTIRTTNQLLSDRDLNLIGAKTGYLDEAGYTFVCEGQDGGNSVVVVLFKSDTSEARFAEARELLRWAYSAYRWL